MLRNIGVRGPRVDVSLRGFRDREAVVVNSEKIELDAIGAFGGFRIRHAISVQGLNLPFQSIPSHITEWIKKTEGVNIQAYSRAQPTILIGQDNWQLISTRELREISSVGFAISRSHLGWALHGYARHRLTDDSAGDVCNVNTARGCRDSVSNADQDDEKLDDLIKLYFQIDSLGVSNEVKIAKSDRVSNILSQTSQKHGNAWEIGLLWKGDHAPNVDSLKTAEKRLANLERRLDRDSEYAALYYTEMDRFLKNGYAKKVDEVGEPSREWYLPHFGVQNANKPNKIRLVFDAAAKTAGISLNDQLESGPDLLQALPGVLIRFRQYPVAFKGDITDMFLRVNVIREDRGAQRFLWRGKNRSKTPDVYEMTCLIFGAKSSPCSAMYIKNKNADQFSQLKPEAVKAIKINSYMDDFLASRKTVQEASKLIREVAEINASGNFKMHSWASNVGRVLNGLTGRTNESEKQLCDRGGEKVLGLLWDTQTDKLAFHVSTSKIPNDLLQKIRNPTKREYLRIVMSVFDPLGFLSPLTLESKILMQEIWRSGIGWDDPIRDEEYVGWTAWLEHLRDAREIRIPRCISPTRSDYTGVELHVFCDASLKAYTAAAYIRFEFGDSPAHVSLVMAKTRVAPLKPLSVPRLELQAALIGARLAQSVQNELEISVNRRFFWSDSTTIIRWIKSEPRTRQVFVANRLGEIGEISKSFEWRWVPSRLNPADDATRWSSKPLSTKLNWFGGPDFLRENPSKWPIEKPLSEVKKKTIDEMELRKGLVYSVVASISHFPTTGKMLGWPGLLTVARRVRSIFERWRGRPRPQITVETISFAEQFWYREIQSDYFGMELTELKNGRAISRNSKIAKLRPFIDENGILRASGRATKILNIEFENNPIILEGKHRATKLLVADYHRRFSHATSETVVNELRQRFYIVGLRGILRSLISRCVVCRLRRGKPKSPVMSALPAGRVAFKQKPFSHCGVDYFGPMFVKIGRRREKRWGVLFTCLTTRAVHLELAHSLSTSSAIMALQRLAARRGCPLVIYSDNGTNFVGASKEVRAEIAKIDKTKQESYAVAKQIKWIFNPPDAPHMGGSWERLVRSVKTALSAILKDQAPSEEVLHTVFAEIEHSVNSRPLTHVSVDPRDDEALTPNHFLIGVPAGEIKLGVYEARAVCLKKQYQLVQAFAEAFWRRWLREYLPTQLSRKKWTTSDKPLEIGDLVLIIDYQAPRNMWKRGTITDVYPGEDGEVRVAKVRTSTGTFVRPARKLVHLFSDKVQKI